jgi:hypothetical protein
MDDTGADLAGYQNVNIPQLTTKGKVDPYDLSQMQQQLNLSQDITGGVDDLMLGAFGGPGAFGPEAFQPTYDYGEPLNLVGRKKAQQYMDVGGYQGYVADLIMNQGMGPDEAAQNAIDLAMNTDASKITDPKQKALVESLQKSLPAATASGNQLGIPSGDTKQADLPGGRKRTEGIYDQARVLKFASDMFEGIASDPTFAYQDEATGNFYSKTPEQAMQKTEAMKAFDKAGIPYITDQYSDQGYIDKAISAATGRGVEQQAAADTGYQEQMRAMEDERAASNQRQQFAQQSMGELQANQDARKFENMTPDQIYRVKPKPTAGKMPMHRMQMGPFSVMAPTPLDFAEAENVGATEPAYTPPPAPMFYVDKNGNIVASPIEGGNPSMAARNDRLAASGLTPKKAGSPGVDMAQLQAQFDRENTANTDFYKKRSDLMRRDPNLDRITAIARAQALGAAGRTPTRDALMQRLMAQRAMGFGQGG